jgi:hypothetical protein
VRKPFSVCWKRHTPWFTKFEFENFFFIILHYKYPRKLYTSKNIFNSCFAKLRANSNLFSFFYTPCMWLLKGVHGIPFNWFPSPCKFNVSSCYIGCVQTGCPALVPVSLVLAPSLNMMLPNEIGHSSQVRVLNNGTVLNMFCDPL